MTEVVELNLSKGRVLRAKDNADVPPLDLLRYIVSEIESGEIRPSSAFVVVTEDTEDRLFHHRFFSNLDSYGTLAILELAKKRVLEEWGR